MPSRKTCSNVLVYVIIKRFNKKLMSKKNPITLQIEVPVNYMPFSGLRSITKEFVSNIAMVNDKWISRFEVIVDELSNNACEHGSANNDTINVSFSVEPQKSIEIKVSDNGTGKSDDKAEDIKKMVKETQKLFKKDPLAHEGIRGRGLSQTVSAWVDEMVVNDNSDGGITIIVRKEFKKEDIENL